MEDTRGKGRKRKLNLRDFWERFRSPILFQALSTKSGAYSQANNGSVLLSKEFFTTYHSTPQLWTASFCWKKKKDEVKWLKNNLFHRYSNQYLAIEVIRSPYARLFWWTNREITPSSAVSRRSLPSNKENPLLTGMRKGMGLPAIYNSLLGIRNNLCVA